MNAKKANWAFLVTVVAYFLVSFLMLFLPESMTSNLLVTNLLLECALMLPILVFILVSKERIWEFLRFHKIKAGTVLMIALFTVLTAPLLTLVNAISMFWVDNEAVAMLEGYQTGGMPFWQLLLATAVIAPLCEEAACRGGFYCAYRKSGSAVKAMLLSAMVFALIHMNFNQASYAFVMGFLAVLLVEATGSLWSSILYHALFNASSSLLVYVVLKSDPQAYADQEVTAELLMYGVGSYLVITAVCLPLAFAVLVWISKHEGKKGFWAEIWKGRKLKPEPAQDQEGKPKKDKLITLPLVAALILCLLMMTGILGSVIIKCVDMLS